MVEHLEFLHKSSIYAVVLAGFFALASSGRLAIPTVAAFAAAALVSWFVDAAGRSRREHVPWWNGFVGVCLVLSVLHVAFFGASVLMAAVRFLLLLGAVRLMTRHRVRDELQIYALAFLMMAAAAALNEDVTYGVAFAGFVLTGTFSLALFHLKRELRSVEVAAPFGSIPFDRRYVAVLGGLSVAIFAASLVLFVGFPRVGLGFFEADAREGVQVSGFSDSVELGSHGISRDNPEVALRVQFPEGRPGDIDGLHWRTLTFDRYERGGWSRTLPDPDPVAASESPYDLSHRYGPEMPRAAPEEVPERLEMYVEPLDSDVLPTLWPTDSVVFDRLSSEAPPGSPRAGEIGIDAYRDLSHSVPSSIGIPYELELRRRPPADELRAVRPDLPLSGPDLEPFLQLPESVDQIERLTRRLTRDVDPPYAKARALERFFQREFTYTTDLPDFSGDDPLQQFLFETRRGHCEYYATAMVVMLRTLGIPARLVNGFLGGQWNSVGDYLAVRQQDAHSWVEFFLPGYGWIPMDPTPTGTIHRDRSTPLDWVRESYGALRMIWLQWIIEYDLETQLRFLSEVREWAAGESDAPSSDESDGPNKESRSARLRPALQWVGFALLCLLSAWRARRLRVRGARWRIAGSALFWSGAAGAWMAIFEGFTTAAGLEGLVAGAGGAAAGVAARLLSRRAEGPPATRLFERIERSAARGGLERRSGEPPAAFLRRIAANHPELRDEIDGFRRRYLAARFGGRPLDDGARRSAERAVDPICQRLDERTGS